jgi:uncharacterized protein YkwD
MKKIISTFLFIFVISITTSAFSQEKYTDSNKIMSNSKDFYNKIKKMWPKNVKMPKYSLRLSKIALSLKKFNGKKIQASSLRKYATGQGIVYPWIIQNYLISTGNSVNFIAVRTSGILLRNKVSHKITHFGFQIIKGKKKNEKILIFLTQKRLLTHKPFPIKITPNKPLKITGNLAKGVSSLQMLVAKKGEKTKKYNIKSPKGNFKISKKICSKSKKGKYNIQLLGKDKYGSQVLAIFPIYCGVKKKLNKTLKTMGPAVKMGIEEFAKSVFKKINNYRASKGIKKLKWSEKLYKITKSHSAEMCKLSKLFHISPTTGTPAKRMKKAKIKVRTLAENVSFSSSPESTVNGWIESEGHRLNMINKKVNKGAVGVCKGKVKGTIVVYFSTLLVAKFR